MAGFDFKGYLSSIDPLREYNIIELAGGKVNLTIRAVKIGSRQLDVGTFPSHKSSS
jgi:hypothetical protein